MDNYLLIRGARQLLTLHGRPGVRRGAEMNDLGVIEDGSVLIRNRAIAAVGPTRRIENLREARDAPVIPANGRVILPGFVDPSLSAMTGAPLQPIRKRSLTQLSQETAAILRSALQHGTTRAEMKIGGQNPEEDLRSLRSMRRIDPGGRDFVRTWRVRLRGAAEQGWPDALDYLKNKVPGSFVEVEASATTEQVMAVLMAAAAERRLPVKLVWDGPGEGLMPLLRRNRIHAITTAGELEIDIRDRMETLLVVTAGASALHLGRDRMQVRRWVDDEAGVALSTGYDPVRSPVFNMQMAIALAVIRMRLTVEEAITAATVNAAYASGLGASTGSLEYGKEADLQILNLSDYRDLPRQFGVNHAGLVIRSGAVVFNRIGWKPQVQSRVG